MGSKCWSLGPELVGVLLVSVSVSISRNLVYYRRVWRRFFDEPLLGAFLAYYALKIQLFEKLISEKLTQQRFLPVF